MKRTYTQVVLEPVNEVRIAGTISAKKLESGFSGLLLLMAQVCDEAASGSNCWLSMGATKEKSALVLTLHTPEGSMSVYASLFDELAAKAQDLL